MRSLAAPCSPKGHRPRQSAAWNLGFAAPLGGHKSGRPGAGRVAEAAEDEARQGSSREFIRGSLAAESGAQACHVNEFYSDPE